jgi:hypothetical protein
MNDTILSLITFLPLVGVLILFFLPKDNHGQLRGLTLGVTGIISSSRTYPGLPLAPSRCTIMWVSMASVSGSSS